MASIRLNALSKTYAGGTVAVRDVNLSIEQNEFIVLVGPSGCGKSTTLRMVAGLEEITGGEIYIGEREVSNVVAKDRDIAMVFQNYALYPHMSVYQNMSFGLRLRKVAKDEIQRRVQEAAEILEISELLERLPKNLSGGQRQRVAMGRAIVRDPEVFLFDEPLSNLDAMLRVQMRTQIKKIHRRVQTTVMYVTHDQVEAMTLADRIVVMNGGKIEQVATPQEMYDKPATRFVAGFIGSPKMNFIPCRVIRKADRLTITLGNELILPVPSDRTHRYQHHLGRDMLFGIRPEHITEKRAHTADTDTDFSADLDVVEPLGVDTMVYFDINGHEVCARAVPTSVSGVGKRMELMVQMDKMHLIDPENDQLI